MRTNLQNFWATLAFLFVSAPSFAYDVEIDGIYYNLLRKAKTAEVTEGDRKQNTSYTGNYHGDIVIPSSFEYDGVTYSVNSIGKSAFSYSNRLSSITIPNSVTKIGDYAFKNCIGLTSISIPKSITEIGSEAFYGCEDLNKVYIDDLASWCKINFSGNSCFGHARKLFINNKEVVDLVIPDSVTSISNYAFENCECITSITISNSVTEIGYCAFAYCKGLKSINIPNSVKYLSNGAFEYCSGLTTITLPNSVISISDSFRNCTGLTSINIPNSVTRIDDYAFEGCTGLTSINIPNSVTRIDDYAFSGCTGLASITIPNSVTQIGIYAFKGCRNLETVICYATTTPADLTSHIFEDAYVEYATLLVPESAIEAYKTTAPWSSFGNILPLTEEQMSIDATDAASLLVSQQDGIVKISGMKSGSLVTASTIDGKQVAAVESEGTSAIVNLTEMRGSIVILNAGGNRAKILIK